MHSPAPSTAKPAEKPRTRLWLLGWLLSLLLLASVVAALQTNAGIDLLVRTLVSLSGGAVQLGGWQGRWLSDITLIDLRVQAGTTLVRADRVHLRWSAAELLQRRLRVHSLQVGVLRVTTASSDEPLSLPQDLRLPLAIDIEQISLDRLWLLPQALEFSALSGKASLQGNVYHLSLERLHSPWGSASASATLNARPPFALRATASADLGLQGRALQANLKAFGTLSDIDVRVDGKTGAVTLAGDALAHPFAADLAAMLPRARLRASGINLAAWQAAAPVSDLLVNVDVMPLPKDALSLSFSLSNRMPGAWDKQRLPLKNALGEGYLANHALRLKQLELTLPTGRVSAHGSLSQTALDVQADIRDVDAAKLLSSLLATRLSGQLQLQGSPQRPTLQLNVRDPRLAASGQASLLPLVDGRQLRLRQLRLSAGSAEAELNGVVDLTSRTALQLSARLQHFNPAAFGAFPPADLNGRLEAAGRLDPRPDLLLNLQLDRSSFRAQPLHASGKVRLQGENLSQMDVALSLGGAHISLAGALGRSGDQLNLTLDVPDFSLLAADWHGQAKADLVVSGEIRRPAIEGLMQLQHVRGPRQARADNVQLQVHLPRVAHSPASISLEARNLAWGEVQIESAQGKLDGILTQHQLSADVRGELQGHRQQIELKASGGWHGETGWLGQVERFATKGVLDLALMQPTPLAVSSQHVNLGRAELQLAGGSLLLQQTEWGPKGVVLRGNMSAIQVSQLLLTAGLDVPLQTDLQLAGDWQLAQGEGWHGQAHLYRSGGDVALDRGDGSYLPLALQQMELNLQAAAGKLTLDAQARSKDYGVAHGQAQWWPAGDGVAHPLSAALSLDVPSLVWLGPMLGPQMSVAGKLTGNVSVDGVAGNLHWAGDVHADSLALNNPDWGMAYSDGSLRARLDPAGVQIEELRIRGGEGLLSGQGQLSFQQEAASGQLKLVTDKFVAMNRPDMQLTLSGSANSRLAEGKLDVSGNLRADSGFFRFSGGGVPSLSDDVVIVGRQKKKNGHQQKLPLSLVLDLDLGKKLRFEGWGIRTGLTGSARVRSVHGQPLNVVGTVRSVEGRYTAYGQDLKITKGALAFQGPLENPGLDVIAVRENLAVEPGVHLTGSLQSPRLTLIADSDMSEQEKLSWLILGRPPAEGGQQKADTDILVAAATALLSSDQSSSLQQQIAGRFGVDEIGLRSRSTSSTSEVNGTSTAATQQVVAVGKRLSDKAYLVYEQGADAASAAVKLTYRVSRQWSLVAKAGQESQFDVFWNFWFD